MILTDVSLTCQTTAHTGIQRVTRCVARALEKTGRSRSVVLDEKLGAYRGLTLGERTLVAWSDSQTPSAARSRREPWVHLRQWLRSGVPARTPDPLPSSCLGLFCPEVPTARHAALHPAIFKKTPGPKLALFYDALPLLLPSHAAAGTVARFPAYLRELLRFDAVGAISETSKHDLLGYWRWLGETRVPEVRVLPFGFDHGIGQLEIHPAASSSGNTPPAILCVGTLEGRKNHTALLHAAEQLWADGELFSLRLIGMAHRQTGRAAVQTIRRLQSSGHPLIWDGPASDADLESAYAKATFTVYPSLQEGFGMPVAESLRRGKPCICSGQGALGEVARDGGCLTLPVMDPASLAFAMRRLLHDKPFHASLARTAAARTWPTWDDFAQKLLTWMEELKTRAS